MNNETHAITVTCRERDGTYLVICATHGQSAVSHTEKFARAMVSGMCDRFIQRRNRKR